LPLISIIAIFLAQVLAGLHSPSFLHQPMPDMLRLPDNGMGNFSSGFLPVSHQAYFQGISQATRTRCPLLPNAHETFKA